MELSDVISPVEAGVSLRRARVISVEGGTVTVDLGGTAAGMVIERADHVYPVPNRWVLILVTGQSMTAIASIGGEYKQTTLTLTGNDATTVSGLVNGVSRAVTKLGAFTVASGDVLPLLWSADGAGVWVGEKPGVPYVPPPAGGGGTGGGGGVTSGTASYPATWAGNRWGAGGGWKSGNAIGAYDGAFFYGAGRFRELQGRTITGFRANLTYYAGNGAASVYGHPHASPPTGAPTHGYSAGSFTFGGWVNLPIGLAGYLIGGAGTGGLTFVGTGANLNGIPYGTLQFDWRR